VTMKTTIQTIQDDAVNVWTMCRKKSTFTTFSQTSQMKKAIKGHHLQSVHDCDIHLLKHILSKYSVRRAIKNLPHPTGGPTSVSSSS
jgi:hypothetical protein